MNTPSNSDRDESIETDLGASNRGPEGTQPWSAHDAASPGEADATDQAEVQTRTGEAAGTSTRSQGEKRMATIGQSIIFKGELAGDEDLEIEGQVDGDVSLANHQLTVGANGRLKAQIVAKSIIVIGQVIGDLTATERIEIQATGVVEGDIRAPRLTVQEGAVLKGAVDMSAASSDAAKPAKPPQAQPQAAAQPSANPAPEARKTA